MAESSASHSGEADTGDSEEDAGGGSQGARVSGEVEKVREIGGCQVVESLERHDEDFVLDAEVNRKPMQVLENGGNVVEGGGSCDDAGS